MIAAARGPQRDGAGILPSPGLRAWRGGPLTHSPVRGSGRRADRRAGRPHLGPRLGALGSRYKASFSAGFSFQPFVLRAVIYLPAAA